MSKAEYSPAENNNCSVSRDAILLTKTYAAMLNPEVWAEMVEFDPMDVPKRAKQLKAERDTLAARVRVMRDALEKIANARQGRYIPSTVMVNDEPQDCYTSPDAVAKQTLVDLDAPLIADPTSDTAKVYDRPDEGVPE